MRQKKLILAAIIVVVVGVIVAVYTLNLHKSTNNSRIESYDASFRVNGEKSDTGSHVTDFAVTINKWDSPPSNILVDVYLVTNRSGDVVQTMTGGKTAKSNVHIGVFGSNDSELRAINGYLNAKHLSEVGHNYYSLDFQGSTPMTIELSALTPAAVPATDWRMLLVATTVDKNGTNILWVKTIEPQK